MAELIWKGKDVIGSPQHDDATRQLCTTKIFGKASDAPAAARVGWHNRLVRGDRSEVLAALLPEFAGQVDLMYIDPPFMTGRTFTVREQPAYHDTWHNDLDAYIHWLYETLRLLYQLLAQDGCLYVHLDWRVIHYAKVLLDEIFGFSSNGNGPGFKSEIIWHYESGGRPRNGYARKHDTLLLYTRSAEYCFHGERIGQRRGSHKRNHMRKQVNEDGKVTWTIRSAGRLYSYDEDSLMTASDVWSDISHLHQQDPERNGYATQKPAALLERILLASSEENDLVLDCCCGSGVTPAVAEQLGRRWIACDQSPLAIQLTQQRLLALEQVRPFVLQSMQ